MRMGTDVASLLSFLSLVLTCFLSPALVTGLPLDSCAQLGFAETLMCSKCQKLRQHVPANDPLIGECDGCCIDDTAKTMKQQFASASLDVCS